MLTFSNSCYYHGTLSTFSLSSWPEKKAELIGLIIKDRCTFIPFESALISPQLENRDVLSLYQITLHFQGPEHQTCIK